MNPEIWLPVVDFENRYEISDLGRVRSLCRQLGISRRSPRVLKPRKRPVYFSVALSKDNQKQYRYIHLMVLTAFRGTRPNGREGSHINGNSEDNRLVNRAWETARENIGRKEEHGTMVRGAKHYRSRLNDEMVREIRGARSGGAKIKDLAKAYGYHHSSMSEICSGKKWRHVT